MAVITNKLKKQVIDSIKTDFDNASNRYYIGLGKSEQFNTGDTVPVALNHDFEERTFRNALQAIMEVSDFSFVVERVNWSAGSEYSAYNDKQVANSNQSYYVMNDENQVYVCVQQGKNINGNVAKSTVKPTGESSSILSTSDGYLWKFLYSISAASANKFVSANFLPVKLQGATSASSPAADVKQLAIQTAAVAGQIVGYEVLTGGSGYSSAPTITIIGDGTNASAVASINGGEVTKVEINFSGSPAVAQLGSGYTNASITVTGGGGTGATVRPIFGTKSGLGANPIIDLRSTAVMFTVKPTGAQGSDFIVGNKFRQVGLLRNPLQSAGGSAFTATTGRALRQLILGTKTVDFTIGATITGANGAKGIIDNIENSGQTLSYHQNEDTGYLEFVVSNNISGSSGGAGVSASSSHITAPEFGTTTGEVLYIDNRAAVTRAADQTEDIKIVIQI
jgi:hypothetical protein